MKFCLAPKIDSPISLGRKQPPHSCGVQYRIDDSGRGKNTFLTSAPCGNVERIQK